MIALLAGTIAALVLAPMALPRLSGEPGEAHPALPARTLAHSELARRRALEAGIRWRRSEAVGLASKGRLVRGVLLPEEGVHFFSWDGRFGRRPNPPERRWGTGGLVRAILEVCAGFAAANPDAARCAIGDLSREHGGPFGRRYGGDGHRSHQNGLDVDVYYPRADHAELAPATPAQIDRRLAQDLVDRFVAAGAELVFVGPAIHLRGPPDVVQRLANHDDHMHVRLSARAAEQLQHGLTCASAAIGERGGSPFGLPSQLVTPSRTGAPHAVRQAPAGCGEATKPAALPSHAAPA